MEGSIEEEEREREGEREGEEEEEERREHLVFLRKRNKIGTFLRVF